MDEIEAWIRQLQSAENEEARADAAEELGEFGGAAALRPHLLMPLQTRRMLSGSAPRLRSASCGPPAAAGILQGFLSRPAAEPARRGGCCARPDRTNQMHGHSYCCRSNTTPAPLCAARLPGRWEHSLTRRRMMR